MEKEQEKEAVYRKFRETKQERLRLEAALKGFFLEENETEAERRRKTKRETGTEREVEATQEMETERERKMERETEAERRSEYGRYLKNRIRPAVEKLIGDNEIEKLQVLEEKGFFGERELEGFLKTAREQNRPAVLLWLLRLKNEKYGYRDRDFSL